MNEQNLNSLAMNVEVIAQHMSTGEFTGVESAMDGIAKAKNVSRAVELAIEDLTRDEKEWVAKVRERFAQILADATAQEEQAKTWLAEKFKAGEVDKVLEHDAGTLTMTERRSVEIVDVAKVPKRFFVKPDTAEIGKALKAGDKVPGAKLTVDVIPTFKAKKD